METLTFIGLANYKLATSNYLVNIIFKSTGSEKTTYQYNFSLTEQLPAIWLPIPTLTDVTIPANREISAQLDTTVIIGGTQYYLYIKSITSINTIWQTSTAVIVTNGINTINDYITNLQIIISNGGSIDNSNLQPISTHTINSNVIYSGTTASINIPSIYNNDFPIFIMSNLSLSIVNSLTSTSTRGSINIVGYSTSTLSTSGGIVLLNPTSISGNITLNGMSNANNSFGININNIITIITISGNVTLNGMSTGSNSSGIGIRNSTINATNTVIINGNAIGTNNTRGIYVNGIFNIIGYVTINGTSLTGGIHGIYIDGVINVNNITDNVIFNGKGPGSGIIFKPLIANPFPSINSKGIFILNGIGPIGINFLNEVSNITGNVILNGTSNSTLAANSGININTGATTDFLINDNVILNGTSNGNSSHGINCISTRIITTGNVIFNGIKTQAGGNGIGIRLQTNISIINTQGNLTLNGIANGNSVTNYGILLSALNATINGNIILNGKGYRGIGITNPCNIAFNVKIYGISLNSNGNSIWIEAAITIQDVFFIITISDFISPYIRRSGNNTITGFINIQINPSSMLSLYKKYNLLENIPANNIGTMTGLFNTIRWNIISTSSNNWALVTEESRLVNGDISGSNIVIDDKYYMLLPDGVITFKYTLYDVTFILETQSILVTSSKNGTILYISDDNIIKVIATGLYGITTIMQDNNKNIYYTIIRNKLFYIYKLGTNGNAEKLLLQGQGENIEIFYSYGNMIVVNTDTNIILTYKFVYDIMLKFIYKNDVFNLGIITNIINNNGTLLFLFNNNTIYKFNTFMNMINIYHNNINYSGIALTDYTLYGIINNGGILSSTKLLFGYILTNN